ncbi:uncharacterized protein DNG_00588 [Cephalotrichum gorgonifer]|uniref:Uncharacterized protein n=1 Tax=Cephalotrichum gorgonifer TaxID=2041049 RepID=A0AAE8SR09_9PEZI|nr:uncharacterized protein DNG_00588 [Cephalotrichum gorgonifer]
MSNSMRYHLRGTKTEQDPFKIRTMALEFADQMLQPPVYPKLNNSNKTLEEARNYIDECEPHFRPDEFFPTFYPEDDIPRTEAPNNILRVSKMLNKLKHAGGKLRRRDEEALHTDDRDTHNELPAGASKIRDTLSWCLNSIRPTVGVVRARHRAHRETLVNGPPMPSTMFTPRNARWEVDWENPAADVDDHELDYLASVVQSEWFSETESH